MSERVTRPKPERTEPIRNWSTLLTGGGDAGGGALSDVITRSVELGYRVIDEYVRQGQKAAERMTGRPADPAAIAGDLQEMSVRMAQVASELVGLWFQAMGATLGNAGGSTSPWPTASPSPSAGTDPPAAPPATGDPVRVRVEVESTQPLEVSVDLRPGADQRPLIVHALRAVDPALPPLHATPVPDADQAVLRVRLQVPDDQPPGVYSGLLIDEQSSVPVGALSVRVGRA